MDNEVKINEKRKIEEAVDLIEKDLRDIAMKIHANPELGFEEYKAVEWLTGYLKEQGFTIEKNVANLETAFIGTWEGEPGGPTIGILAEYDALPGIGHACGHNIIGTSAVGAAVALKNAYPHLKGKIKVIGTPAEEGGGGKIYMCDDGVFNDLDAAMMTHPKDRTMVLRGGLACIRAVFKFYGKESHAASAPENGISALDAMINSFVAINGLREYFTDDVRVHGIITNGGEAPNVVPGYSEASFIIRASTRKNLIGVKEKVYNAVKGSSLAVGATCEIEEGLLYAERNNNVTLAHLYQRNLELQGITVYDPPKQGGVGSSDIGNVGQIVPTIHPYIRIGDAGTHTLEFTEATKSEGGMQGLTQAAKAMAMTTYDLCTDTEALEQMKEEFSLWKANN